LEYVNSAKMDHILLLIFSVYSGAGVKMIETRTIAILGIALLILAGLLLAKPDMFFKEEKTLTYDTVNVTPSKGHATVTIPSHATEISPGVFFLGTAVSNGKLLEGYAFVDYKEGFGKPTGCNYNGVCQGWEDATCDDCAGGAEPDSSCYGFLAKGARWRVIEPFIVNPENSRGLSGSFVLNNLAKDIVKWENASGKEILGLGSLTSTTLSADYVSPDNKNEVYFADIADRNAIAITVVWGIFRGPPSGRELVEWDQVYDDVDFDWSSTGVAGKMDFENIATHELGHSVGLGDLYEGKCSQETMYGYATEGETKKRSLESGDIAGVKELYK
jgi:hypothetical protein